MNENGFEQSPIQMDKTKKLPAFLRERAATHFYATPVAERATYDAVTKKAKAKPCVRQLRGKTNMQNLKPECFAMVKKPTPTSL